MALRLSTALIRASTAENLLRALATALRSVPETAEASLCEWSYAVTVGDPWIAADDDSVDRPAIGRSIGMLQRPQAGLKAKLGSLLTLLGEDPPPSLQNVADPRSLQHMVHEQVTARRHST